MRKVKDSITDLSTAFGEVAIDAMMEQGVLRDIPILGSAVGVARATRSVRDALFLAKLQEFMKNLEGVSEAEKQKMRCRLENEEERESIGEKLVFVLESADELAKARLLGKCFRKYLEGVISKDELFRFWHAVDKCFISDLKELKKYRIAYKSRYEYSGGSLLGAGLIESADVGGPRAKAFEANEIEYTLTVLGKRFYELFYQKRRATANVLDFIALDNGV